MITFPIYFILLLVLFLVGSLLNSGLGIKTSIFSNLLSALVFLTVLTALIITNFTSIFSGLVLVLLYLFFQNKLHFNRPKIALSKYEKADITKALAFSISFFFVFYFLGGRVGSGQSLHHDFLYYIDVSWHIEKTGIEGLVTNPVDESQSFPSGYHYFIPWLLVFIERFTFGELLSYELLLHVIFPSLTSIAFLGVVELLRSLNYSNNWKTWFVSIIPLLTFGVFFNFYRDFPILHYGDRFIYGVFNSYWSGKILVSLLIIMPLFRKIIEKDSSSALALMSLLCFLSLVHLPVSLIMMTLVIIYDFSRKKVYKSLFINTLFLLTLTIFFQLFYRGKEFIPMPGLTENLNTFFSNFRTSIILMAENLIQVLGIFTPAILLILIRGRRLSHVKSLKELFFFILILVVCSSGIWILFRENFGSSEFFKLVGSTWINSFIGLVLAITLLELLQEGKTNRGSEILVGAIVIFILAFRHVDSRIGESYSTAFFEEIQKEDFNNEIILTFESEKNKFLNLPGQFNPFVHYDFDVIYQQADGFSIISGSNIFSKKFKSYLKDPLASSMLVQDPLYQYALDKEGENSMEILLQFIEEYQIRYLIFDEEYDIPENLLSGSELRTDALNGQKLLIRNISGI